MCRQFDSGQNQEPVYAGITSFPSSSSSLSFATSSSCGFLPPARHSSPFHPSLQDSNENTVVSIVELPMMKMTIIEKTAIIGRIWPWIG